MLFRLIAFIKTVFILYNDINVSKVNLMCKNITKVFFFSVNFDLVLHMQFSVFFQHPYFFEKERIRKQKYYFSN